MCNLLPCVLLLHGNQSLTNQSLANGALHPKRLVHPLTNYLDSRSRPLSRSDRSLLLSRTLSLSRREELLCAACKGKEGKGWNGRGAGTGACKVRFGAVDRVTTEVTGSEEQAHPINRFKEQTWQRQDFSGAVTHIHIHIHQDSRQ